MQNNLLKQDRITFANLANGEATIIFVEATNTVAKAAAIHNTSPVATAALGRALIATSILGARLKDDKALVSVSIKGGGPIGTITTVSNGHTVKGSLINPHVEVPNREDGKLNVGAAVGKDGNITVVKDLNMKSPYVGQTELISGELAEDFAYYFAVSEQQPCLISLGVLVNGDNVLSAGGVMVAPMPGCTEETLQNLEIRSMMMADISRELTYDPAEQLIERWFDGMHPEILHSQPLDYICDCSRYKMEAALLSLGRAELQSILEDEQDGAELICHFCHTKHFFSDADIAALLAKKDE
ncbi:MAG: Hsp33 family molecular chaperone HslO [Eubacteriales bacterium]|nr:Hsp33 family molecular chaperone HslO [Eubacteriales bacterium]